MEKNGFKIAGTVLLLLGTTSILSAMEKWLPNSNNSEPIIINMRDIETDSCGSKQIAKELLFKIVEQKQANRVTEITVGEDADLFPVELFDQFKNLRTLTFPASRYMSEKVLGSIPKWITELNLRRCRKTGFSRHELLQNADLKFLQNLNQLKVLNLCALNVDNGVLQYIPKNIEKITLSSTKINNDAVANIKKLFPDLKRLEITNCDVKIETILKLLYGEKKVSLDQLNVDDFMGMACFMYSGEHEPKNLIFKTEDLEVVFWMYPG